MLQHNIELHRTLSFPYKGSFKLDLSCDNCCGQNKPRFVIWFTLFTAIVSNLNSVTLQIMVLGHTKNHVEGAFSLIKRRLSK